MILRLPVLAMDAKQWELRAKTACSSEFFQAYRSNMLL